MHAHANGFLNVDLDITCENGLDVLIAALDSSMFLLVRDGAFASLEAEKEFDDPSETIVHIANIVDALPASARALWVNAEKRILNVGVESASVGSQQRIGLSAMALARAIQIGATIEFTIYNNAGQGERASNGDERC